MWINCCCRRVQLCTGCDDLCVAYSMTDVRTLNGQHVIVRHRSMSILRRCRIKCFVGTNHEILKEPDELVANRVLWSAYRTGLLRRLSR